MARSPAGADNFILQETISEYSDEAYTSARKLSGTDIVAGNDKIDTTLSPLLVRCVGSNL